MKLTNRLNLPQPLVDAITNDNYEEEERGDYSTTGLLKPPRMAELLRQHRGELTDDASNRIWALFGQVVHGIIERSATTELVEERLFMEVNGKKISGRFDLYQGNILWDWKTTSIYSGKDGPKDEWVQQGNINRLLCVENGIDIKEIRYVALYRDWSQMAAMRKAEYPESQVEVFPIAMWPLDRTRAFVEERIRLHEAAKTDLPMCNDEERWAKPEKWALMKKGQKRAVKLYDSEEQAEAAKVWVNDKTANYIEHRPGEDTRCLFYCSAVPYCTYGQSLLREKMEQTAA